MKTKLSDALLSTSTWIIFAFIYLPIAVLVVFSFNQERINAVWTGFTFDWYIRLFNDSSMHAAIWNSLVVGVASTIIATVLGTLLAYGMHKYRFPGKMLLQSIVYLPIIIPEIVMAVAMLSFYVWIQLTLGTVSIIIAHVSFNISFVAVVVMARLAGLDPELESAARDLGATPWQAFRKVTLPLITPGIIAGALLAFTLSWDDFLIAFFTAGVGSTTLPMRVYSMIKFGVSPEINAISTLMLLFSMILIFVALRIQGIYSAAGVERASRK